MLIGLTIRLPQRQGARPFVAAVTLTLACLGSTLAAPPAGAAPDRPPAPVANVVGARPLAQVVPGAAPAAPGAPPSFGAAPSPAPPLPPPPSSPDPMNAYVVATSPRGPLPPGLPMPPAQPPAGNVAPAGSVPNPATTASGARPSGAPASGPAAVGGSPGSVPPPSAAGPLNGARVASTAQSQLGARYTWGGTSPATGFDCSGLVYWTFATAGRPLPRTMPEQLASGRRVQLGELQPGDVVFFENTYTTGLSHNGIYVGDGKFIHAADESTGVVLTPMQSAYWAQRFAGAIRVIE